MTLTRAPGPAPALSRLRLPGLGILRFQRLLQGVRCGAGRAVRAQARQAGRGPWSQFAWAEGRPFTALLGTFSAFMWGGGQTETSRGASGPLQPYKAGKVCCRDLTLLHPTFGTVTATACPAPEETRMSTAARGSEHPG